MDVGVEAKGRRGDSVTPPYRARIRRRGLIRPRSVSVCSVLLFTIKTIPKKKKKKKKDCKRERFDLVVTKVGSNRIWRLGKVMQ